MLEAFLRSKLSLGLEHDPDVFERLLRGLLDVGPDAVRAALPEVDLSELGAASWRDLEENWLRPLAGDAVSFEPPASARGAAAGQLVASVLDEQLAAGRDALLALQTDSGDAGSLLLTQVQGRHLDALIRDGSNAQAEIARAVRAETQHGFDPIRLFDPADPVDPGPPGDWSSTPREDAAPWDPAWLALLGLTLAAVGWTAAIRRWPKQRTNLFRAAAIAAGPCVLVGLEATMSIVGVPQPLGLLDRLSLTRHAVIAFEERKLGGVPHVVTVSSQVRSQAFTASKPLGTLRIVTLGESSAHASNYLVEEGFSALLGEHLQQAIPDRDIEMLHGGIGGALSARSVQMANETTRFAPDLFVLYFGNNDLKFLPQLVEFDGFDLDSLAWRTRVGRTRILGWPAQLLRGEPTDSVGDGTARGEPLSEAEADRVRAFAHEEVVRNMTRIVRRARSAGADAIIVVQGPWAPLRAVAEDAARRSGAVLVDGAGAIQAHAEAAGVPGGPNSAYYYDDIHPTRLGHAILAQAIAPPAVESLTAR